MKALTKILVMTLTLTLLMSMYGYALQDAKDEFAHMSLHGLAQRACGNEARLMEKATKVPVLMYHHLLNANDKKAENGLILTTEEFEQQMKYLADNGFTSITTEDI